MRSPKDRKRWMGVLATLILAFIVQCLVIAGAFDSNLVAWKEEIDFRLVTVFLFFAAEIYGVGYFLGRMNQIKDKEARTTHGSLREADIDVGSRLATTEAGSVQYRRTEAFALRKTLLEGTPPSFN